VSEADTERDGRVVRATAQRESRRAELLQVALRVFARKGYHDTRISDIIEAAGIARGTFYLYFDGKGAMFLELLDGLLARLRASVVGVDTTDGAPPVEEQLVQTTRRILETVRSRPLLTTIIIRQAVGLDEEVNRKLCDFYNQLLDYIRISLEQGQALGIVRALDTQVAALCILGSIKEMMEQCVAAGEADSFDVDRAARALLDYHLRGVLATAV
jgi:AcrR family transcriptional regulator